MTFLAVAASALMMSGMAAAQPQHPEGDGHHGRPHHERLTPEQRATRQADKMNEELNLTQKQYKKLYKMFLAEANEREEAMQERREQGGPMGGPGGHMGGPGMGGPGGGMGPGMGGPGGGMGPGMGGPGMGQGGPRPGMGPDSELSEEELLKKAEKREKKLLKILGQEKYDAWRANHPQQPALPMPELPMPEAAPATE